MILSGEKIILRKPTAKDKQAVLAYRDEFVNNNETPHGSGEIQGSNSYKSWLRGCADMEDRDKVPQGKVLATQYLAIRESDKKLVGMLQLRHALTERLRRQGGHIGYSVRKSERRKGYATEMLKNALIVCKELGISKVLLTCDPDNIGSATVMKANGGVHERQVTLEDGSKLDQYWINLA